MFGENYAGETRAYRTGFRILMRDWEDLRMLWEVWKKFRMLVQDWEKLGKSREDGGHLGIPGEGRI